MKTIDPSTYVRFLALPAAWAEQAGMPKEMVLRRLCDWAMAGGFRPGAFVNPSAAPVEPFDIYMSGRAVSEDSSSGLRRAGVAVSSNRWGLALLGQVLLTVGDVLSFCQHTNTLPPPPLGTWRERLLFRMRRDKHLAPPPCPDADELAVCHHERSLAVGVLAHLRSMLDGLSGKPGHHMVNRQTNEPVDFSIWTPKWMETRERAQHAILACGDPSLQPVLDALDAGWAALVAEESRPLAASPASAEDGQALAGPPVRLRIRVRDQSAEVDGQARLVPEQPFKLLCLLARRAADDKGQDTVVEHRTIADHLWGKNLHKVSRPIRDVVRDLRNALEAGRATDRDAKSGSLVEVRHNVGYRLRLTPDEIAIED